MALHDLEELDNDLGRRTDQDLALAGLLGVVDGVERIVEDGGADHVGGVEWRFSSRESGNEVSTKFIHVSLSTSAAARARKSALERFDELTKSTRVQPLIFSEEERRIARHRVALPSVTLHDIGVQQSHLSMVLLFPIARGCGGGARLGLPSPATKKKRHPPGIRCLYISRSNRPSSGECCCFTYLLKLTKKSVTEWAKKERSSSSNSHQTPTPPSPVEKKKWVVCPCGPCTTNCPKGNALSQSIFSQLVA